MIQRVHTQIGCVYCCCLSQATNLNTSTCEEGSERGITWFCLSEPAKEVMGIENPVAEAIDGSRERSEGSGNQREEREGERRAENTKIVM